MVKPENPKSQEHENKQNENKINKIHKGGVQKNKQDRMIGQIQKTQVNTAEELAKCTGKNEN